MHSLVLKVTFATIDGVAKTLSANNIWICKIGEIIICPVATDNKITCVLLSVSLSVCLSVCPRSYTVALFVRF